MARKIDDDIEMKTYNRITDISHEPLCWLLPIEGYEMMPVVSLEKAVEPLDHIVPDIRRKAYIAKQMCQQPADNLSPDESASIMLYTMEWEPKEKCPYFSLNQCLRARNRENLKPWFLFLKLFLSGLDKLPALSCTVYRGVKINMSDKYIEGSNVIWWGFSSCTTNINALRSEKFLGKTGDRTLFTIKCHSGKDIQRHSYYDDESEVLLPAARQFKVVGYLDQGHGFHMIQLEEMEPEIVLMEPVSGTRPVSRTGTSRQFRRSSTIPYQNQTVESQISRYLPRGRVNLTFQNLTDQDIPIIIKEALTQKSCAELDLSDNRITSKGVTLLAEALRSNTTLERLCLSNNHVLDEAISHLANSLINNTSTLKVLGLGSNEITDAGITDLVRMLKVNKTLVGLALQNNKIGNHGVELLMNALCHHNTNLEMLNLSFNTLIDDSCIDSITKMFSTNQILKELYISKCSLSTTGAKRIQQIANSKKDFELHV